MRKIRVNNWSFYSTNELKRVVEKLSEIKLELPEIPETEYDIVLEDDNIDKGFIFIKSRFEDETDIKILKELITITDGEKVGIILKPENFETMIECKKIGFENKKGYEAEIPEMIRNYRKSSYINF